MSNFAQRILATHRVVEAATPKQLDKAANAMIGAFGKWDKEKARGSSEGILTWKSNNPEVKKFPGLKGIMLEYANNLISVEFSFKGNDSRTYEGKTWSFVRKAVRADKQVEPEVKKVLKHLLSIRPGSKEAK